MGGCTRRAVPLEAEKTSDPRSRREGHLAPAASGGLDRGCEGEARHHAALSQHEVETEVDRYISWPGQADSYMLGELTIRKLRAEAEHELGPKFDYREFLEEVEAAGSRNGPAVLRPLDVMTPRVGEVR